MPTSIVPRVRPTSLLLTAVLIVAGLPRAVPVAQARQGPAARAESGYPSTPRSGAPSVAVGIQLGYRKVGDGIQQSTNGGRSWASILSSGLNTRPRVGACHPARYHTITQIASSPLLPGTLFVATGGDIGRGARARDETTCDMATGGLYVLRPSGRGRVRRTDSLAAGLPYVQGRGGHAPRVYDLLDLAVDPASPDVLYADAAAMPLGTGVSRTLPDGLYRSTNGGLYWSPAMSGLPRLAHGLSARSKLVFDPAHTAIMFDVIGSSLYRSVDRGGVWSRPYGIRARSWLRLFINPTNPLLAYALTDLGLFRSRDGGVSWAPFTNRRLPAPGSIRAIGFHSNDPSGIYFTLGHGYAVRLQETDSPRPPRFDTSLALTPLAGDRVVLALHTAPASSVQLAVVAGANYTSAHLTTDHAGYGYATLRLTGSVVTRSLRVRVRIGSSSQTIAPWLPRGWVPGRPSPRVYATSTPTATLSPTATISPTATVFAAPTPYPPTPLNATWSWKPLTSTLPPCAPTAPSVSATPVSSAPVTPSATAVSPTVVTTAAPGTASSPTIPTQGAQPPINGQLTPATGPQPHAMQDQTVTATAPSPDSTPAAGITATMVSTPTQPAPTSTPTPAGPCDAGPPSPRQDYAAGWDDADHRLYIFGGTDSKTAATTNDLSSYSTITNSWSTVTPVTPPPAPRYGASSVWDPAHNMLIVFGGMVGAGPFARFYDDVWAYAPGTNSWLQLAPNSVSPAGPAPRAHAAVAWDPANNRLLIFGGQVDDHATPTLTNDLWAFNFNGQGGTWSNLSPNGGGQDLPPQRQWASIGWDAPAGVLRLFGGKNPGSGSESDTWIWSPLSGWQYDNVPDQPAGRQAAGYYWDDSHQRFVVGPGLSMAGNSTDTWYYDAPSHDWLQIPIAPDPSPPPRQMAHMVWDAADGQALLFGGRQVGAGASNDLWALVPGGTGAPIQSAAPGTGPITKGADLGQVVSRSSNHVLLTPAKVQMLASTGASFARFSFYIGDGQQSWTPGRLQAYESVIKMLSQQNIGVLAVASAGITGPWSTASWTQNAHETSGGNGDNPAIDDYVNQLVVLVTHFFPAPFYVRRWELWNEPNVPLAGCTNFTLSCLQQPSLQPSNFAALLALAFKAVKSNPDISAAQLISGGIFGHSINGSYSAIASGAAYLANTYTQGINGTMLWPAIRAQYGTYPMDEIGQHLYVDQGQRTSSAVIRTYLAWFHDTYAVFEGAGKDTALTEVGWRTGDTNEPQVTPDIQALNLNIAFAMARRVGFVKELSWFELQDDPGYLHNTSWGLLDRGGNPKPALLQYQAQ